MFNVGKGRQKDIRQGRKIERYYTVQKRVRKTESDMGKKKKWKKWKRLEEVQEKSHGEAKQRPRGNGR